MKIRKRVTKIQSILLSILLMAVTIFSYPKKVQASSDLFPSSEAWIGTSFEANRITNRVVSGDFNGDGYDEIAEFYDAANGSAVLQVFKTGGYNFSSYGDNGWWMRTSGYSASRIRGMVAGNFNGDKYEDIAVFYSGANGEAIIHVFESTGSSFTTKTGNYEWWKRTSGYSADRITNRMVADDFNGDGLDDIAVIYDGAGGETIIHVFESNGKSFTTKTGNYEWWKRTSGYHAAKTTGRVVAGNFNGDNKADLAVIYDCGNNSMRIHVFESNGKSFVTNSNYEWAIRDGNYDANKVTGRVVAGDYNSDGLDDIAVFYDYSSTTGGTRMHVFQSTGKSFSSYEPWVRTKGYDASKITGRVVSGNFRGDSRDEIAAFYDYGNRETRIHLWSSNLSGSEIVIYTDYNVTLHAALDKQMTKSPQVYSNGTWVNASRSQVLEYLNPNNYSTGNYKYQFLDLSASAGISEADMKSFLSDKGILAGKEKAFLEAAKTYNVSEVYLAAHSCLETRSGTSELATGVVVNGVKVYNMYGINAVDASPVTSGAQYAYKMGWTTPEKAIIGGAKWISEQYINNSNYRQNTLYKMRWNPASPGNHQYATDIGWAVKQTDRIYSMYKNFKNATLKFDIPKYKN